MLCPFSKMVSELASARKVFRLRQQMYLLLNSDFNTKIINVTKENFIYCRFELLVSYIDRNKKFLSIILEKALFS